MYRYKNNCNIKSRILNTFNILKKDVSKVRVLQLSRSKKAFISFYDHLDSFNYWSYIARGKYSFVIAKILCNAMRNTASQALDADLSDYFKSVSSREYDNSNLSENVTSAIHSLAQGNLHNLDPKGFHWICNSICNNLCMFAALKPVKVHRNTGTIDLSASYELAKRAPL